MIFTTDDEAGQQKELTLHLDAGLRGARSGPLSTYVAFAESAPKDETHARLWRFLDRTLDTQHVLVAAGALKGQDVSIAVEVSPAIWPGVAVGVVASTRVRGTLHDVVMYRPSEHQFEGDRRDTARISSQLAFDASLLIEDEWNLGTGALPPVHLKRYTAGLYLEPLGGGEIEVTASYVPPNMGLGTSIGRLLQIANVLSHDVSLRAA